MGSSDPDSLTLDSQELAALNLETSPPTVPQPAPESPSERSPLTTPEPDMDRSMDSKLASSPNISILGSLRRHSGRNSSQRSPLESSMDTVRRGTDPGSHDLLEDSDMDNSTRMGNSVRNPDSGKFSDPVRPVQSPMKPAQEASSTGSFTGGSISLRKRGDSLKGIIDPHDVSYPIETSDSQEFNSGRQPDKSPVDSLKRDSIKGSERRESVRGIVDPHNDSYFIETSDSQVFNPRNRPDSIPQSPVEFLRRDTTKRTGRGESLSTFIDPYDGSYSIETSDSQVSNSRSQPDPIAESPVDFLRRDSMKSSERRESVRNIVDPHDHQEVNPGNRPVDSLRTESIKSFGRGDAIETPQGTDPSSRVTPAYSVAPRASTAGLLSFKAAPDLVRRDDDRMRQLESENLDLRLKLQRAREMNVTTADAQHMLGEVKRAERRIADLEHALALKNAELRRLARESPGADFGGYNTFDAQAQIRELSQRVEMAEEAKIAAIARVEAAETHARSEETRANNAESRVKAEEDRTNMMEMRLQAAESRVKTAEEAAQSAHAKARAEADRILANSRSAQTELESLMKHIAAHMAKIPPEYRPGPHEDAVSALLRAVQGLNGDKAELERQNALLTAGASSVQAEIRELGRALQEADAERDQLRQDLAEVADYSRDQEQMVEMYDNQVQTMEAERQRLERELGNVRKQWQTQLRASQRQIGDLEAAALADQNEVRELAEQVRSAEEALETQRDANANLSRQLYDLVKAYFSKLCAKMGPEFRARCEDELAAIIDEAQRRGISKVPLLTEMLLRYTEEISSEALRARLVPELREEARKLRTLLEIKFDRARADQVLRALNLDLEDQLKREREKRRAEFEHAQRTIDRLNEETA